MVFWQSATHGLIGSRGAPLGVSMGASQSKMLAPTRVFLLGPPGSGKSTLVNALATNGRCLTAPCEASSANQSVTKFPTEFHHGVRSLKVVHKNGREEWSLPPEGGSDEEAWRWFARRVSALGDDPTVDHVCLFDAWAFPGDAVIVDTRGVDEINSEVLASADVVVQLTIRMAERRDFALVFAYGARPDAVYVNAIRFSDRVNDDTEAEIKHVIMGAICEDGIMCTHLHLPSRRAALRGIAARSFMAPCADLVRGGVGDVSAYVGFSRWLECARGVRGQPAALPRARLDFGLKAFLPEVAGELPVIQGELAAVAALPECRPLRDGELEPIFLVCSDAHQLQCLNGLNARVIILSRGGLCIPDAPQHWSVVESDGSLGFATGFARRMGFEAFWFLGPGVKFHAMVSDLDSSAEVEMRHALLAVQTARADLLAKCVANVAAALEVCGNSLVLAAGDLERDECRRFDAICNKIRHADLPLSVALEFATLLDRVNPRGAKNRESAAALRRTVRAMLSVTSVGFTSPDGQQALVDQLFPRRHTLTPAGGVHPCALYSTAIDGGVHVSTVLYSAK